jgi:three-Cys-motif partner protein
MQAAEPVGYWSIDKLDLLEDYLKPYAVIMNAQKSDAPNRKAWLDDFYYIDAFAGPGAVTMRENGSVDQEAQKYLDGSTMRAVECRPPFDHLWFIDKRQSRKHTLTEELKRRDALHRASIVIGDCNKILDDILGQLERKRRVYRALAFLDPYGLQLDWSTVLKLANTKKLDVFINFSLMGVTRNLSLREKPSQAVMDTLNRVMADTS